MEYWSSILNIAIENKRLLFNTDDIQRPKLTLIPTPKDATDARISAYFFSSEDASDQPISGGIFLHDQSEGELPERIIEVPAQGRGEGGSGPTRSSRVRRAPLPPQTRKANNFDTY